MGRRICGWSDGCGSVGMGVQVTPLQAQARPSENIMINVSVNSSSMRHLLNADWQLNLSNA